MEPNFRYLWNGLLVMKNFRQAEQESKVPKSGYADPHDRQNRKVKYQNLAMLTHKTRFRKQHRKQSDVLDEKITIQSMFLGNILFKWVNLKVSFTNAGLFSPVQVMDNISNPTDFNILYSSIVLKDTLKCFATTGWIADIFMLC